MKHFRKTAARISGVTTGRTTRFWMLEIVPGEGVYPRFAEAGDVA